MYIINTCIYYIIRADRVYLEGPVELWIGITTVN